jgi:hypothetical protein
MNHDGFTDLRIGVGSNDVNEGFWPSFTDIMTVVVMIFLISMVVLLVRNIELVSQLRATVEAERIAAELARATGEEKDSLSSALHRAEDRVQRLQLEVMRLQDKAARNETLIAEQLSAISALTNQRDDLEQQATQLLLVRERLAAELAKREGQLTDAQQLIDDKQLQLSAGSRRITALEEDLASLETRYTQREEDTARLQALVSEQRETLAQVREERRDFERRYLVMIDDFDDLKVKYDKLVKPARSSSGRHLIEVRYWKQDDSYRIAWREGGEGGYQNIQNIRRDRLDRVLTRLAEEKPNGLYVKVIFPENSGLSYNEAWEFTSHLHSNYDYYFRAEADAEAAAEVDG